VRPFPFPQSFRYLFWGMLTAACPSHYYPRTALFAYRTVWLFFPGFLLKHSIVPCTFPCTGPRPLPSSGEPLASGFKPVIVLRQPRPPRIVLPVRLPPRSPDDSAISPPLPVMRQIAVVSRFRYPFLTVLFSGDFTCPLPPILPRIDLHAISITVRKLTLCFRAGAPSIHACSPPMLLFSRKICSFTLLVFFACFSISLPL